MIAVWADAETSTYQDHVIAHVVGATVLGHFVREEALHLLLDIDFVWTIYTDGQMLLRHERLALAELGLGDDERASLAAEFDALHAGGGLDAETLSLTRRAPSGCEIGEVEFYSDGARRKFVVGGEGPGLVVESDTETGAFVVTDSVG